MQLQSITQIEMMTNDAVEAYINELTSNMPENYPWEPESIRLLIQDIKTYHAVIMTHHLVLSYLGAYAIENRSTVSMRTLNIEYIINDSRFKVIRFSTDSSEEYKYMIIPNSVLDSIIRNIHYVRDNGDIPEDMKTRAELEIDIQMDDNRNFLVNYLMHLGILTEEEANTIIPEQSETINIDETTERFSSALWFEEIKKQNIMLAGLGGIGSYVAFLLSRMHPNQLYIYDDDIVEPVNMAGQLYGRNSLHQFKVDAVADFISNMSDYRSTFCIRDRYTRDTSTSDVMICGFDNMDARRVFFNNWINHVMMKPVKERKKCIFIDGRLAAEEFQVFCIRGDDEYAISKYSSDYLFSDSEADETLCSYKQTTYMANMIGSIIVNLFTNFVANSIEDNIRELPFITTYDGSTMDFKIKSE